MQKYARLGHIIALPVFEDGPVEYTVVLFSSEFDIGLELGTVIAGILGLGDYRSFWHLGGRFQRCESFSMTWRYMNAPVKHVASSQ